MKVVITGAAGFLGSHLADAYLARGDRVYGIDSLITGRLENLRKAREEHFSFLAADVAKDQRTIETWLSERAKVVDLVLHFASPASPRDFVLRPLEILAANSAGTDWCCRIARNYDARLLYASSSEVYGNPLEHPQTENGVGTSNSIGPRSCYVESKRFGEATVISHVRTADLDGRIVRLFNAYGPRMTPQDGRVAPTFITQALAGEPLTIQGDGKQTRSFCFVDDIVEGVMRAADSAAAQGVAINLGNPAEISILEFAAAVSEAAGVEPRTTHLRAAADDPVRRKPDISRARALLDWQPQVALRDGLQATVAAYRAELVAEI